MEGNIKLRFHCCEVNCWWIITRSKSKTFMFQPELRSCGWPQLTATLSTHLTFSLFVLPERHQHSFEDQERYSCSLEKSYHRLIF